MPILQKYETQRRSATVFITSINEWVRIIQHYQKKYR